MPPSASSGLFLSPATAHANAAPGLLAVVASDFVLFLTIGRSLRKCRARPCWKLRARGALSPLLLARWWRTRIQWTALPVDPNGEAVMAKELGESASPGTEAPITGRAHPHLRR